MLDRSNGISRRSLLHGLAGAAAFAATARASSAAPALPLVALVHTQSAGDNGVIDGMIASLKRLASNRHLRARAVYAADPANFQPILELLGEAGAAVVLTTFNEMREPLLAVAPAFAATRFIHLYGDPVEPPVANLRTVSYETHLAAYLAGVCAAKITKTRKIGYIGGASIPTINADANAMEAGARSVDSRVSLNSAFVGSFQDPAKGRQIAEQMFSSGIDFIQCESSASDIGIIQSASAHAGRTVSAGSTAEFALGPAAVAAVLKCDFGASLYEQTSAAFERDWSGGHYRSGLGGGVVDFVGSALFRAHAPAAIVARLAAAWPAVEAAKRHIIAGSLTVPFKTALG